MKEWVNFKVVSVGSSPGYLEDFLSVFNFFLRLFKLTFLNHFSPVPDHFQNQDFFYLLGQLILKGN